MPYVLVALAGAGLIGLLKSGVDNLADRFLPPEQQASSLNISTVLVVAGGTIAAIYVAKKVGAV